MKTTVVVLLSVLCACCVVDGRSQDSGQVLRGLLRGIKQVIGTPAPEPPAPGVLNPPVTETRPGRRQGQQPGEAPGRPQDLPPRGEAPGRPDTLPPRGEAEPAPEPQGPPVYGPAVTPTRPTEQGGYYAPGTYTYGPRYYAPVAPVYVEGNVVELGNKPAAVISTFAPVYSIEAAYVPTSEPGVTDLALTLRMPKDPEAGAPVGEEEEPLKATITTLIPVIGGRVSEVPAPDAEVRVDLLIREQPAAGAPTPATGPGAANETLPVPESNITLGTTRSIVVRG